MNFLINNGFIYNLNYLSSIQISIFAAQHNKQEVEKDFSKYPDYEKIKGDINKYRQIIINFVFTNKVIIEEGVLDYVFPCKIDFFLPDNRLYKIEKLKEIISNTILNELIKISTRNGHQIEIEKIKEQIIEDLNKNAYKAKLT